RNGRCGQRTYQSGPSTSPPAGVRAACQFARPAPGLRVAPRAAGADTPRTPPSARATWIAALSGDEAPPGLHAATLGPSWGDVVTIRRGATVPAFLPTAVRSTTMGQALNADGGPDPHSIRRSVNRMVWLAPSGNDAASVRPGVANTWSLAT